MHRRPLQKCSFAPSRLQLRNLFGRNSRSLIDEEFQFQQVHFNDASVVIGNSSVEWKLLY